MVKPDIYGSSLRNLLHVTLFALLILMCFLDFTKTCAPLCWDFSASPRPKRLSFLHQLVQKYLSCYFCLDPSSKYAHLRGHFIHRYKATYIILIYANFALTRFVLLLKCSVKWDWK